MTVEEARARLENVANLLPRCARVSFVFLDRDGEPWWSAISTITHHDAIIECEYGSEIETREARIGDVTFAIQRNRKTLPRRCPTCGRPK